MHNLSRLTLIAAALLLGACGQSNNAGDATTGKQAQVAAATAVTGTVSLRTPAPLTGAAQLQVKMTNVSAKPAVVVAEKNGLAVGALPASFQLDFDPAKIDPNAFYVVEANIVDGERHYVSARQYPVLTKGAAAKVDVQLNPEQTAGEKVEEEYRLLERGVGGMKRVQGSSEEDQTAWDGFFDKSGLRYIREVVDVGEKGKVSTNYGYRTDGKLLMVVRENIPAMSERANASARLGLTPEGEVVVRSRRDGGSTGTLADADIKSMRERAKALYDSVSKRKP